MTREAVSCFRPLQVLFVAAIVLCLSTAVEAQRTAKLWRLGYLDPSSRTVVNPFLNAFREELDRLGWSEGKKITIEYRFADLKLERMPELAAELVNWKADVIVAAGGGRAVQEK